MDHNDRKIGRSFCLLQASEKVEFIQPLSAGFIITGIKERMLITRSAQNRAKPYDADSEPVYD